MIVMQTTDAIPTVHVPAWAQPADEWVRVRQELVFADLAVLIVADAFRMKALGGDLRRGRVSRYLRKRRGWRVFEVGVIFDPRYRAGGGPPYYLYLKATRSIGPLRIGRVSSERVRQYSADELRQLPTLIRDLTAVIVQNGFAALRKTH